MMIKNYFQDLICAETQKRSLERELKRERDARRRQTIALGEQTKPNTVPLPLRNLHTTLIYIMVCAKVHMQIFTKKQWELLFVQIAVTALTALK